MFLKNKPFVCVGLFITFCLLVESGSQNQSKNWSIGNQKTIITVQFMFPTIPMLVHMEFDFTSWINHWRRSQHLFCIWMHFILLYRPSTCNSLCFLIIENYGITVTTWLTCTFAGSGLIVLVSTKKNSPQATRLLSIFQLLVYLIEQELKSSPLQTQINRI